MNTKRIKGVDVNLDAFKDVKSLNELKKEPGKIFGHLSSTEEGAAYEELGVELGLTKPTIQSPSTTTAPAQNASTATSPAQ